MDRPKTKKNENIAKNAKTAVISLTVLFGTTYFYRHSTFSKMTEIYRDAWNSTEEKAAEIQQALVENEKLRYENANLRLKLETAEFEAQKISAEKESGANKVDRSPASISYQPPSNLLPSQLFTLGVTYFKAQENEKAAVIFSFLTQLDDNSAYRNSRGYVMTGVSWYRLGNLSLADHYFDLALKEPDQAENLHYQAQARLWKGVIAQRQGKSVETQYWLRDLLDHHPQSIEAAWVNAPESKVAQSESTSNSPSISPDHLPVHSEDARRATASVPESKE